MANKRDPRKDAAYVAVPGLTAEQAAEKGYAVVEYAVDGGANNPVYGYYLDTVTGASLEQVVRDTGDTVVAPASGETVVTGAGQSMKSNLLNPNDPVIHGTGDQSVHADGSEQSNVDIRPQLEEGAKKAGE